MTFPFGTTLADVAAELVSIPVFGSTMSDTMKPTRAIARFNVLSPLPLGAWL
jgi:hypothetical protein